MASSSKGQFGGIRWIFVFWIITNFSFSIFYHASILNFIVISTSPLLIGAVINKTYQEDLKNYEN